MNRITPFRIDDSAGQWSQAVADVCFPETSHSSPVYLSPTDEQMIEIAQLVGVVVDTAEEATQAMSKAIQETLNVDFSTRERLRVFAKYRVLAKFYRGMEGPEYSPPPCLALLALLGRAARLMGSASGYSPNNFYGPLALMLQIAPEKAELLGEDYRHDADDIWFPLPHWLASHNGKRGVSTLHSFGKNIYIAVPLSQAIFVENDAHRISEFFDHYDFSSTSIPSAEELLAALDRWVSDQGSSCPQRVRELWPDRSARETITEMLRSRMELHKKSTRLVADSGQRVTLRYIPAQAPFREASLGFSVRLPDYDNLPDQVQVSFGVRQRQGTLIREANGTYRLEKAVKLSEGVRDLIGATFKIHEAHDQKVIALHKSRDSIYVLARDVPRSVFIESTNPPRGAECVLFVDSDLAPKVALLLSESSQDGWTQAPFLGAPGWTIFERVFIRKRSKLATGKLSALQPRSRQGVQLSGGLELQVEGGSGIAGSWLAGLPPAISVLSEEGFGHRCSISRLGVNGTIDECFQGNFGPELFMELLELNLFPGRYRIAITPEGGAPYPTVDVLLVSPSSERQFSSLDYSPSLNPLWPLTASGEISDQSSDAEVHDISYSGMPIWAEATSAALSAIPTQDLGTRYNDVPEYSIGDILLVEESVGTYLGIVERDGVTRIKVSFPPSSVKSKDSGVTRELPMAMWDAVTKVSPTTPLKWAPPSTAKKPTDRLLHEEPADWEDALAVSSLKPISVLGPTQYSEICEAISCIENGRADSLSEIAEVAYPDEPTALARYKLIHQLESEAKINVTRDHLGQLEHWHLSPPRLIGLGGGAYALAGILTHSEYLMLDSILTPLGFRKADSSGAVFKWDHIESHAPLPKEIHLGNQISVQIDPTWVENILHTIAPMSGVIPEEVSSHRFGVLDRVEQWRGSWNEGPQWREVEHNVLVKHDAVRIVQTTRKIDGIILGAGEVLRANSDHTKLLSGALNGWNLAQYSSESDGVVMPLGINPPGLYGRALRMLSSDQPSPAVLRIGGSNVSLMRYPGVPRVAGERICGALNG
jgi:hypothetical protein